MKHVIAISGSHRLGGNTEFALNVALQEIQGETIQTELITLADKQIRNCIACDQCRKTKACVLQDDFADIAEKVLAADGLIFGCPVYSFAPPPLFLALRTRLSRLAHVRGEDTKFASSEEFVKTYPHPSALMRKPGGSIVVARRGGADMVLATIDTFFQAQDMFIVGSGYLNIAFGYDKGTVAADQEGLRNITKFGQNFKWLLERL